MTVGGGVTRNGTTWEFAKGMDKWKNLEKNFWVNGD